MDWTNLLGLFLIMTIAATGITMHAARIKIATKDLSTKNLMIASHVVIFTIILSFALLIQSESGILRY